MNKKLSALIRVLVSLGLISVLFWIMRDEIQSIVKIIARCDLRFIAVAGVIIICNVTMLAYRMKVVFLGENLNITFKEVLQLTYIGYFFNNFMPTAVGGDIVKAHYAGKTSDKKVQSYASVFMDRILGLYSFLIVAGVALIVDRGRFELEMVKILVFSLLILGVLGFIVVTNQKVADIVGKLLTRLKMFRLGEKIHSVYKIVQDYRNRLDVVLKSFVISIFSQCLFFLAIYLFFLSLGAEIKIGNIFLVMPVVTFVSMIPSVGGLGVRESAIVLLFDPLVGREMAFAMSLLYLAGLFGISFIGGIVYLWWNISRRDNVLKEDVPESIQ